MLELDGNKILLPQEVADLKGCSLGYIHRLIRQEKLNTVRFLNKNFVMYDEELFERQGIELGS
jgi:hypothetical protein